MSTNVGFTSNKDIHELVGDVEDSIESSLSVLDGSSISNKPTLEGVLIMIVIRLILHGYKHIEIKSYLENKHPTISSSDQLHLLRDAERKISVMFDDDQEKMYKLAVSRYDHIYHVAMKAGDYKTAVGTMDRIVKLFNLDEYGVNKFRGNSDKSHYDNLLEYINE